MNKFLILTTTTVALFIAGVYFTLCSTKKTDAVLTVGMMSGWAPFMTINAQGNYEGFDVDVAQELANRMGKGLEIQDLGSLAPCFLALEQNKVDMVLSGLDITEQRLAKLSMIQYTGQDVTTFELVFWNNIPATIKSIEDLRTMQDAVICAEAGSAQEKFLDQYTYITKKPMGSATDMLLDVKYGKSLAFIIEPRVAARFKKQESSIKTLPVPLPKEFRVYGEGIGINKKRPELRAEVIALIAAMKTDGILAALEKKWGLGE